jgi:type VI secretion system protein ImpA
MATPTVLDVEPLLLPIAGDNPSGRNLFYEPQYDELREARRVEDDTLQGDWKRKAKQADWDRVVEIGSNLLQRLTKDLQVAAWMTEALARKRGLPGLRDGLVLVRELQERFWDTYYPSIEDGDVESRSGPFVFLNNALPLVIRSVPLTAGMGERQYSYLHWQEARTTENVGLQDAEKMEELIAEGKTTPQQFEDAVAQTPRRFYENLLEDLLQARDAFTALDQSTDERFGRDAPSLTAIRKAIDDCRLVVEPIVQTKRELEPSLDDEPSPEADDEAATDSDDEPAATLGDDEQQTPRKRPRASRPSAVGPIQSVDDALSRIVDAAAYLRQNDPSNPVPFLVVRALRMGEVYATYPTVDPSLLEAPSSESRQALRRLANEGEWSELLERSEQALARPEGRGWLDPHRYAVTAMGSADPDRSAAAAGVRAVLRAFLADHPDLPDAELSDGTPAANAETRAWLRAEVLPAAVPDVEPADALPTFEPPPRHERPDTVGDAAPDVWEEALELARSRRAPEGIQLIRRAMNAAATGRERFLRKLQLAELCLMVNHHRVALPLSEDLARQVDEYRLEQWEDEQLSARVWGALYRCLRASGADVGAAERLQQVFTRLCRLDIHQAMMFGDEGAQG